MIYFDRSIKISSSVTGHTLAAVLRKFCKELSWAELRRLIAARRVLVNGTVCLDDARRLKEGDAIQLTGDRQAPPPAEREVRIVYSDADLVVVDKPAGLQTVRRPEERDWSDERKRRQPVLEEVVQAMLAAGSIGPRSKLRGSGKPAARVRAVHRLDRDTSGLMIFAISPAAETELIRRFASHQIQRAYWAVVCGILSEPRTIDTHIVRDRGDGLRGSVAGTPPPDAQRAITHVRPIARLGDHLTLVECRLETGRTHQIRIHLAETGHMLCGEKIYVRPRLGAPVVEDRSQAPRQALHSGELEFSHPATGAAMRFESAWPAAMARWIEKLAAKKTP